MPEGCCSRRKLGNLASINRCSRRVSGSSARYRTAEGCADFACAVFDFSLAAGFFPRVKDYAIVLDFPACGAAARASFLYIDGGAPGSAVFALRSNFSIFYTFPGERAAALRPNACISSSFLLSGPFFPAEGF